MATFLYRLGRLAFRKRWWFVSAWLVVLLTVGAAAFAFSGKLTDDFKLPGTTTQQTIDRMKQLFPDAGASSGTVLFESQDGKALTDAQRTAISTALHGVVGKHRVGEATDPFERQREIDRAGTAVQEARTKLDESERQLDEGKRQVAAAKEQIAGVEEQFPEVKAQIAQQEAEIAEGERRIAQGEREADLGEREAEAVKSLRYVSQDGAAALASLSFTGTGAVTSSDGDAVIAELNTVGAAGVLVHHSQGIPTTTDSGFEWGEVIGVVIAAIVLFVMTGTVVAAGLPLLMAVVGVAVGLSATLALSSVIEMVSMTPMLALMLGLAVGIDYTLFIVHRHRQQLLTGMDVEESVGRALGTSGNAVVFAGLTVVIALAALVVPGVPFLSVLGLSAAATVAFAVVVSVTLTPALLGFIGIRLLSKRARAELARNVEADQTPEDGDRKWGALVTRRPWAATALSVLLLGVIALPVFSMRTALPDAGQELSGSPAQRTYAKTAEHFGNGYNAPMITLVDLPAGKDEAAASTTLLDVADLIRPLDGVASVVPAGVNTDRTAGILQITPVDGPTSEATENLVHAVRDKAGEIKDRTGAEVNLASSVAMQIDVSEKITAALVPYLSVVIGLSLVLLLLVFRSILVPVLATAGFLLSLAAGFGAVVAVYQWGWLGWLLDVHQPAPIMSFLPILLTGILFGLAMDYQVFLVSAMREAHTHGLSPRAAVRKGFNATAPVVTAAALIMVSVFAGFLYSELTLIRPIGFALAIGVLADAFIVRMTLTPAVMTLLGERAWYLPRWLDRVLPDVDVEGAKLHAQTPAVERREPAGV